MLWLAPIMMLVALFLAVLLLPARLSLHAISDPPTLRVGLRVMGRAGPRVTLFDSAQRRERDEAKRAVKGGGAQDGPRRTMKFGAMLDALRDLLRSIRIETLRLRARFGLDDPAETGALFGVLCPMVYAVPSGLVLEPVFTGPVLECEGEAVFVAAPIRLAGPGWRLVRAARGRGP